MPYGIVIPADPQQPLQARTFAKLEDYQYAVNGFIEALDLDALNTTLYANDEGLIYKLPLNPRATVLLWLYRKTSRRSSVLVGDVVLIGTPDEDGNTTDLPETVMQTLLHKNSFRIELKGIGRKSWSSTKVDGLDYFDAANTVLTLLENLAGVEQARILPVPPLAGGQMDAAQA